MRIISFLLCLVFSGCVTISATINYGPDFYGGTKAFFTASWGGPLWIALDLPLTLILDTLMLPIVILYKIFAH